ncbi:hypothetical protein A4X09_0g7021 [Tilletia walkeri]|uniref:F-box domain-containing protein n=1 Tax=Tilletia walkeri TaxID=117179 RepID=A0A8X7N1Q8_9BASI|nr:hypothetical protein A4X09_0g7021 [Tilletia walkeri]
MESAMDLDVVVLSAAAAMTEKAVSRVFNIPELLQATLVHATRDKVDLFSASTVSKRFRAVAVPLLWRELDVPLSKIGKLNQTLLPLNHAVVANPRDVHLFPLAHTRYLRIWDDEARRRFRYEPHSKPNYVHTPWRAKEGSFNDHANPQWNDRRWESDVSNLFSALTTTGKTPLIELSFGVISSSSVNRVLQDFPQMAERVAAIRVLSDAIEDVDGMQGLMSDDGSFVATLNEEAGEWWAALVQAVSTICYAQDKADSHALKAFSIEDYDAAPEDRPRMDSDDWETLAGALAHRIQQLSIQLPVMEGIEGGYKHILGQDWPQLRHFYLKAPTFSLDRHGWFIPEEDDDRLWDGLQECLETFFDRHTHLEHIEIEAPYALPPLSLSQTFSRLKRFSFYKKEVGVTAAFFLRHPTLSDFSFHDPDDAQLLSDEKLASVLRVVRGVEYLVIHVFFDNKGISHFVPEPAGVFSDLCLDHSVWQEIGSAHSFTCFNLELYKEDIQDVIPQVGSLFHGFVFPNLTELVLTFTKAEELRSATDSAKILRGILTALQFAPSLRALHFEFMGARPLPPDAELLPVLRLVPPALEYLSWHSPVFNQTQYYRLINRAPFEVNLEKIQSLPASSRLRVSRDGIWSQNSNLRDDKCIFDHTHSPPRLRF